MIVIEANKENFDLKSDQVIADETTFYKCF